MATQSKPDAKNMIYPNATTGSSVAAMMQKPGFPLPKPGSQDSNANANGGYGEKD